MADAPLMQWQNVAGNAPRTFTCGYCGKVIASDRGYYAQSVNVTPTIQRFIYICGNCYRPTYFDGERQVPGVAPGSQVSNVPQDVDQLFNEALNCVAVGSYTSAVLTCRKLLMNIAVGQGADEGESFLAYVEFLAAKGFVPPHGKGWVDHIRKKSNEANHQIVLMSPSDADDLLVFVEMLLKFIFEFPSRVPKPMVLPNCFRSRGAHLRRGHLARVRCLTHMLAERCIASPHQSNACRQRS